MLIQSILATELRLLEPICTFEEHPGYLVYRSELFRNYYGGNGIEILDPTGMSLAEWEAISRRYFDPARFVHTTFTFADRPEFKAIADEAEHAGYNVERNVYMYLDTVDNCRAVPAELEVCTVGTEEEWGELAAFEQRDYVGADWNDPSYTGPDRLFEKKRFISDAIGIEWFLLKRRGEPEILSKLGIFVHNGIARLQDVATARDQRRKGYAGYLVGFAVSHALQTLGARGAALLADSDYHAVTLYEKLGFARVGSGITLMRYPRFGE
jgi:GNAT superfamily N-acetyltransferase